MLLLLSIAVTETGCNAFSSYGSPPTPKIKKWEVQWLIMKPGETVELRPNTHAVIFVACEVHKPNQSLNSEVVEPFQLSSTIIFVGDNLSFENLVSGN